jgi:hypothetical protein
MITEEKEMALAKIAELENGGAWQRRQARRLRRILEENPQEFWDSYFSVVNPPSPETAALVRSGTINEDSTFADMKHIINKGADAR